MNADLPMLMREGTDEWTHPAAVKPDHVVTVLSMRDRGEPRGEASISKLILTTGHDLVVKLPQHEVVKRLERAGW